jgi:hypothetical protein
MAKRNSKSKTSRPYNRVVFAQAKAAESNGMVRESVLFQIKKQGIFLAFQI